MPTDSISFTVADIPPADPVDTAPSSGSAGGYTCDVCGVPLSYAGRGRPPTRCAEHKRNQSSSGTSTRRSSSRDVDAAMAALNASHTSLSFLLMMLAPDAATAWEAGRDSLDDRNRRILEADPALAKRIATAASRGGAGALVISHLIAIAPAAVIAGSKVKRSRAERIAASMVADDQYDDTPTAPVTNLIDEQLARR